MKSIVKLLTTAALALSAIVLSTPEIRAADVRLEGYGEYFLNRNDAFFNRAPKQSGRYLKLGRDYYRKTEIQIDYISNLSRTGSGSLSFELWAMPYYGATSGIVMMTRGLAPLRGGRSYKEVSVRGYALSLGEEKIPEFNLWEYTRRGWRNRSHLTFEESDYL
jgi:hypothetical protein